MNERVSKLIEKAKEQRKLVLEQVYKGGSGHVGGSLSSVEIMTVLYFDILKVDPNNPNWEKRDRFVLSKGHCTPIYYSSLALRGYFPISLLDRFAADGSPLQKHPDMHKVPGVDISTGSLGQGLSIGAGMAWAIRKKGWESRVYVLLGDGEIQEGQIWEAAMFAASKKLGNLIAIVDRNMLQIDGSTEEVCPSLEPLEDNWKAFGWNTQRINGHNVLELLKAFERISQVVYQPNVIIAQTIKGKGISITENRVDSHHRGFSYEEYKKALSELTNIE